MQATGWTKVYGKVCRFDGLAVQTLLCLSFKVQSKVDSTLFPNIIYFG